MKRSHLNLALIAVVAGLAGAVWYSQQKEEKGPPLTPFKSDAIHDVLIDHPGAPAIRLHKDGATWQLLEPVKIEADPVEVGGVLALAEMENKLTLDPAQVKVAELQLDPPQYTVTLDTQKLAIGGVEPINYRRYVLTDGKVALIDDPPSAALDQDYSDLVAKTPIPQGAEIVKITLPKLSVERSTDGKGWALTPEDAGAASDARQKFVDGWKNARALWMAAEPVEGSKGDPVTVTLKDGSELHFIIAAREPQLILARPDLKVRYTLSKALEDEILQMPVEKKEAAPTPDAAPAGPSK